MVEKAFSFLLDPPIVVFALFKMIKVFWVLERFWEFLILSDFDEIFLEEMLDKRLEIV